MRLDEIVSANLLVIKLKETRIHFEEEYKFITETYNVLSRSKSCSRLRTLLSNIEDFEHDILPFIQYDFDPDTDIEKMQSDARSMLSHLKQIYNQIP